MISRTSVNRRLLAFLGVAGLVLSTAVALQADSDGREFSRCVQTCNETRKECRTGCDADCGDMNPEGGDAFDVCVADCRDSCNDESSDCKLLCQNIKNPPSPEEP